MRRKILVSLALLFGLALLSAPLVSYYQHRNFQIDAQIALLISNSIAWVSLLAVAAFLFRLIRRRSKVVAAKLGVANINDDGFEKLLDEMRRRDQLRDIAQPDDVRRNLSRSVAMQRVLKSAQKIFELRSAEVALYEPGEEHYHSAALVGVPRVAESQAMLAGTQATSASVITQPIIVAGAVHGAIRVELRRPSEVSVSQRAALAELAVNAGVAIVNSQYARELLRINELSKEAVRAKTGFLANLSHELRGPLGIMINAVELTTIEARSALTPEQLEMLEMVKKNGEHLLDLVNDVLDYAKVESGKVQPKKERIELALLLKEMCKNIRSQAHDKAQRVVLRDVPENAAIMCDRRHARQIITNLLTNAVKYTPENSEGLIEVWVEMARGGRLRINVRDNGVGIDPRQQHKVFAAFERVDNAYSMQQVGTGLGMPLTQRLVQLNGGQIDFESAAGKGAHFWIVFKVAEAQRGEELAREKPVSNKVEGRGDQIVVCSADGEEQRVLGKFLGELGFAIESVASLAEAVEAIGQQSARLLVLDNSSLDTRGTAAITQIRDSSGKPTLPIVLVSSHAFEFEIEKLLRAGVDRYLTKPVDMPSLARTCRELIDQT